MAEHERLTALVEAIADGTAVDWVAAESTAKTDWERAVIRRLGRIERLAALQRERHAGARATPSSPGTSTLGETTSAVTWNHLLLREKIGEGAFGEVYRARDPRLARDVALKLLYEPVSMDGSRASALIDEGRLLARVRHPNVVTVYGADGFDGRVGVWMDFIRGRTLEQVLLDHGPLSPQETALIGLDLCRALAAVHQAGLVHRDLKAQNVMREDGGRVVLMDFGAGHDPTDPMSDAETLSGTPLYLAPEIFQGAHASTRSDLYSLGVLLYHLVTGSYPIEGRTLAQVDAAHRLKQRTYLRDARPDFPLSFIQVVERALAPDPEARYSSVGAMEVALAEAIAPERDRVALPAVSHSLGHRESHWKRWTVAAVIVVSASAALMWMRGAPSHAAISFEARDGILVATFDNDTGEPQLDGAIEAALESELVNSRFVSVVAQDRVDEVLGLMRKPVETRLDTDVAREVALRDGRIRAVVGGQLDKIGSSYVLTASVMAPLDGRIVTSAREQAPSIVELPAALRRLSNMVREALGEARRDIEESAQQLEKVTTPSFAALKSYSQSYVLGNRDEWRAALEFARRAVETDPEFASAQIWLAWCLMRNDAPIAERKVVAARAVELARHATDWERYWIEGSQLIMFDEREKRPEAVAKYKALLEIVPTHFWGLNNLITGLRSSRRVGEAVPYAEAAVKLQPNSLRLVLRTFWLLEEVGEIEEARPYADRVRELSEAAGLPVPLSVVQFPASLAHSRADVPSTIRELDALETSLRQLIGERHDQMARFIANWHLGLGRPQAAAQVIATVATNEREYLMAKTAFFKDDLPSLRAHVGLVKVDQLPTSGSEAMFYLVKAGFLRKVEVQLARMERLDRASTDDFAALRACISLERGNPDWAIAVLVPGRFDWADDCLAEARLRRGEIGEAVVALQDLELARALRRSPLPLQTRNQLRLAELYHAAGRNQTARQLADYVANILSQAEPGFPLLNQLRHLQQALGPQKSVMAPRP